jgi:hypothetical protein
MMTIIQYQLFFQIPFVAVVAYWVAMDGKENEGRARWLMVVATGWLMFGQAVGVASLEDSFTFSFLHRAPAIEIILLTVLALRRRTVIREVLINGCDEDEVKPGADEARVITPGDVMGELQP